MHFRDRSSDVPAPTLAFVASTRSSTPTRIIPSSPKGSWE
jgi:hypothetical protein